MTVTIAAPANGRRRPTLSDSIDRLDSILDGLAEAIPAVVRAELQAGVSAAVAEGVRAAVAELLRSEAVLAALSARLSPPPAPAPAPELPRPSLLGRLGTRAEAIAAGAWSKTKAASAAVTNRLGQAWGWLCNMGRSAWQAKELHRPAAIALAVGGAAAALAVVSPGWVGALLSGLGGAACACVAQVGLWVRGAFAAVAMD